MKVFELGRDSWPGMRPVPPPHQGLFQPEREVMITPSSAIDYVRSGNLDGPPQRALVIVVDHQRSVTSRLRRSAAGRTVTDHTEAQVCPPALGISIRDPHPALHDMTVAVTVMLQDIVRIAVVRKHWYMPRKQLQFDTGDGASVLLLVDQVGSVQARPETAVRRAGGNPSLD